MVAERAPCARVIKPTQRSGRRVDHLAAQFFRLDQGRRHSVADAEAGSQLELGEHLRLLVRFEEAADVDDR